MKSVDITHGTCKLIIYIYIHMIEIYYIFILYIKLLNVILSILHTPRGYLKIIYIKMIP